jgi:alpha-L-rhamnosidase
MIEHASWIEPDEAADVTELQRPVYHLATEFVLDHLAADEEISGAVLHATAHGVYEAFINGERVGDHELSPGFTAYRSRLQVQTFDVTGLLRLGANAIGALLSDGWWRGQHGIARQINSYGDTTAFLAELRITTTRGNSIVVGTDATWQSAPSHILGADLVAGEVHDLRRRVHGWANAGTDRRTWGRVHVVDSGKVTLCEPIGPPARRVEELPALAVCELRPGCHVVDFGQNSHGWIRLHNLGPADTTLTITYGEALLPNGTVTQENIAHSPFAPPRAVPVPFQIDVVTSAGDGAIFEPRHSSKGFRYVQIDGHPGPLDPADITSVVVHTDLARRGSFTCSDDRINRLHEAAMWSFRSNACEIPTDCPTRERSGWTGDWQLYVATAAYLYDVTDFSVKWLLDVAAEQRPDGAVLHIVPDPHHFPSDGADRWRDIQGSAGWGDAACHVPWELYLATGRTDFLRAQMDLMCRWVDFAAGRAATARHPHRVAARPEPLPHERYLWDSGFHFGEWLEPGIDLATDLTRIRTLDHGPTATAYLYRSASELGALAALAATAAPVGCDESQINTVSARYLELAANVLDAWRTEFIDEYNNIQPPTQGNLVRALAFGLVPTALRQHAADQLVGLIRDAGTHLGTGFLATPFLLPVLADTGYLDVAYELLLQDSEPSWLAMIDRGATTIWEQWDGVAADGTVSASLNHYSKGAVVSFLHRYTAGLQATEPGYRRFRIQPRPGGGITSASTHHDSPFGRIEVSWHLEEQSNSGKTGVVTGTIAVVVPPGTAAELVLPDATTEQLGTGHHQRTWDHRVS